jgi:tol-pal system protein YbgF
MKTQRYAMAITVLAGLILGAAPAWGVSREIVELQTQMQNLQDSMTHMQQSFDERMGVMKNLLDQSTDGMNKAVAAINNLQTTLQKQQGDSAGHVDQLSGQIQSLNDSLDELKARLAKVSKQLEDMQAAQQNLSTQSQAQPAAQAPPPDVLYSNALRDYNSGKNDLASQEFGDYVKSYSSTDLAGNAHFYLAEIEFRQANYPQAIKDYDEVIQNFPTGTKAPAAQLKRAYSLIELGQKNDGIAELRRVIQRFPRSNEALQAREKLQQLGISAGTTTRKIQDQ